MKKPIPFGKYLLLERVNVGGMAEVFKAKAFGVEGFERLIAVKRILPSIAEDQEFITMFIDEAKIAVQLTHATIAQIFDLGKVDDSFFIAMEYVHGKDLRAIFDRARKHGETVPIPMACYVMMKVCEGLDYAHNKKDASGRSLNLVHRDVSPQNVLISYDGEIKLIDFGIAKAANKAGKTQAGILKGKFGYMSPEQVRGLPLDRRSDIFSVGIVLYEVLTGERLFVGESDFSTLEKVRNVDIMPPSTYNRHIPEELEGIVLKALAKDVDDRYASAMDLHDDLQSFMYTSENFFARKDLSTYMHGAFGEEIERENARHEQYRRLTEVDDRVEAHARTASEELNSHPAEPTPDRGQAMPNSNPKSTLLGIGAVPPPPPPGMRPPSSNPPGQNWSSTPPPIPAAARSSNPPAPPPAVRSPIPPAPRGAVRATSGAIPATAAAHQRGPALEMEWDDDELATQIYDRPDLPEIGSLAPSLDLDAEVARAPEPSGPRSIPPTSAPLAAASEAPLPIEAHPAVPPSTEGAWSSARIAAREPTEVTIRPPTESGRGSSVAVAIALAGVIVLGALGVGYVVLTPDDPGTIYLTTIPSDAVVVFDGQPVQASASPFLIQEVSADQRHLIEVRKPGYESWTTQVTLRPGQELQLPTIRLAPSSGTVTPRATGVGGTGFTLDTQPSGATVFVDGEPLAERTPVTVTDLEPGEHVVRVEHGTRYTPWETQITVAPHQIVSMPQAVLNLASVLVHFTSEPRGARVQLTRGDEVRTVGRTPTQLEVQLAGSPWTVTMQREGFEQWSQELSVTPGHETVEINATLVRDPTAALEEREAAAAEAEVRRLEEERAREQERVQREQAQREQAQREQQTRATPDGSQAISNEPGILRVNTRPWSQVFVDGQLVGNTPQMNIRLTPGRHTLMLVNPDFNINQTVSVNIQPGQVTTRILTLTPGQ